MPQDPPLPVGKLDPDLLAGLLAADTTHDPRVILGPGIGRDVAILDFGGRALVAKSDPITFATDELGWYAVHVNANDIATSGARPRWFLGTLLLPEGKSTAEAVERIFAQVRRACREISVSLVGGHTEITHGLDRPILCGQMLGEVEKEKLVLPTGIRVGDGILMTKAIAVEGTSILAREFADRLRAGGCSTEEIEEGADHLYRPGISVAADAQALTSAARVHAMHDPTEGGLATGLWEMAQAGQVGLDIWPDRIARLPLCEKFCGVLGLEPLGLIASGTLLAAVDPSDVPAALDACQKTDIQCTEIGVVTDRAGEVRESTPDGWAVSRRFDQDELARLLAEGQ